MPIKSSENKSKILIFGGEAFWVALGQLGIIGGRLYGVRILSDVLPPAVYGEFSLGMSAVLLFHYVFGLPICSMSIRFFANAVENNLAGTFLTGLKKSLVWCVSCLVLSALTGFAVIGLLGLSYQWVILIMIVALFAGLNSVNLVGEGLHSALRNRKIVSCHQAAFEWLRFLFAVWLVNAFGASSSIALTGGVIALLFVNASQFAFLRKTFAAESQESQSEDQVASLALRASMNKYLWPIVGAGVFVWIQLFADRWVLGAFSSLRDVGFYFVLYQLGYSPALLFSKFLTTLVSPVMFKYAGDASDRKVMKSVRRINGLISTAVLLGSFSATGVALLLHEQIFSLLVNVQYHHVSSLLPLLVLSGGAFAVGQNLLLTIMSYNDTGKILPLKIGSALFGGTLYVLGAAGFGLVGVVWAGLLFSLVHCLWAFVLHSRCQDKDLVAMN